MADNLCPGWDPTAPHGIRLAMLTTVTEAGFYGEPILLSTCVHDAECVTTGIFACLIVMSTYTLVSVAPVISSQRPTTADIYPALRACDDLMHESHSLLSLLPCL